ncbi:hypothetical protein QI108_10620 [Staphylococcus saprophyticus]|nr:hypothetical protein [Staphylococcus saprophyticus]
MKIKRKVEMTQEEYAKYMIDKYGVSGFESKLIDDNIIDAPKRFTLAFELNLVPKSDLLNGSFRNGKITIDVDEEITEKTEFELLIEITDGYPNCLWEEASVEDWKDEDSKEFHAYIDGEFKCIWRDGKLVE